MLLEIGTRTGAGDCLSGLRPAQLPGLELGNVFSCFPVELGLQLAAAAQGECGNISPVHYYRGNLAQASRRARVRAVRDSGTPETLGTCECALIR